MTRLARRDRAQQPACAEGGEPSVSNPRCSLRVWPTCGWHSATGEQLASRQAHRTDRQQRSSGAAGSPAERHITLATPAVLQADRGTESHQPPCAGRDGRGGSCDAPVASHREAARPSAKASSQQRQVPVRCSGAVLLRARRNGGSYTSQISAAKGARPRDGSPSTPATQLAQQTRAAAPLVPSFWPPQPPTAELGSAQPNCRIRMAARQQGR